MTDRSRSVDEGLRRGFERARLEGDTRPLEHFLPDPSDPRYAATLEELVLIETEFTSRTSRDAALGLEEWIERFPILGEADARRRLREEWPALLTATSTAEPSRAGRYELVEEIGGGTFARVFRARDPKLGREVAVKMLRAQYVADERTVQRFRREARSAANLHHPDILPIYEVGDEAGIPFLVGLLVEGPTLEQRLRDSQPTARVAASWLARLCDALDYAHRLGVIHRDVKPENVLTTLDGELKLADFGLARLDEGDSSLTRDGDLLGTPAYMSPEQARGDEIVDERADVYSLGVILYRCLTGRLPFEGGWSSVLRRVAEESPLPPSRRAPGIPADLETICMTAMAREREGRYPSAAAMGADLRAYLNHQSIRARRPSVFESVTLWCRREPRVAITTGIALLLLMLVAGLGLRGVLKERDRFRHERDVAQANLYRALVGEARAKLEAGTGAWWWEGMDRIRRARTLQKETNWGEESGISTGRELRDLAIEFVGTEKACLRELTVLDSGESAVRSLAIDVKAQRFAVGREDGTVTVHALPGGEALLRAKTPEAVLGLAFHPRGHLLCAASAHGVVQFFDLSSDGSGLDSVAPAFELDVQQPLTAAACSSVDGRLALALDDGRVWSVREWRPDAERELLATHSSAAQALRFARDGHRLVSVHEDLDMLAWDVASGALMDSYSTGDRITGIDIDDSGRVYGSVYPWYSFLVFKQGETWRPTTMHSRPTTALRLAGRWIFSAGEDGEIKAWTPSRVEAASATSITSRVDVLETDAEGHYLLAGHADGGVCLWEFRQATERRYLPRAHDVDFLSGRRLFLEGSVLEFDEDFQVEGRALDLRRASSVAMVGTAGEFWCGGADGRLWYLDAAGEIIAEWPAHADAVSLLAVEPNEKCVASISRQGELKLWSVESREALASLALVKPLPGSAHWDARGDRLLLSGAEQSALVHWDGAHARLEPLEERGPACFVPGGMVFGSERGELHLAADGVAGERTLLGDVREPITHLIWNERRGELLVVVQSGAVHAFELSTRTWAREWEAAVEAPTWLAFDTLSRYLLVGGSKTAAPTVFDYESTEPLTWLQQGWLGAPAFSVATEEFLFPVTGGGALVLSIEEIQTFVSEHPAASGDAGVRRYDRLRTRFAGGHASVVWGQAVSLDSRYLATVCHGGVVKLWEGSDLPKLAWSRDAHDGPAWSVAFDPSGTRLASTSLDVKLWSVEGGEELATLDGHELLVTCAVFLGGGEQLLTGSLDGDLCLWDLSTASLIRRPLVGDVPIHALALDPSGRWLVAALHDDRLAVWDRTEQADLARGPDLELAAVDGAPWALDFDGTGTVLGVASEGGSVSFWSVPEWRSTVALRGESQLLRSISFSADGEMVAAGCYGTKAIVWDLGQVSALLRDLDLDWTAAGAEGD